MLDSTHPIPGMQHFFLHRRSETSSHVACGNGCGKLTFLLLQTLKLGVASQDFTEKNIVYLPLCFAISSGQKRIPLHQK